MKNINLSFAGDVLIHQRLAARAKRGDTYSFSANFTEISEDIKSSDLASVNLESLTSGNSYGISGYPKFNAPTELLDDLRETGFSLLSVANNHMLDTGEEGLVRTLQNITDADLSYTGASPTSAEPDRGVVINVDGLKVGLLSYTDASKIDTSLITTAHVNHFPGEYRPVRMIRRLTRIKKDLTNLRERAEIVILQLHFGEEYLRYPTAFQQELIAGLCEAPVDAIIAHHPHVLQPAAWIENSFGKQVLVMYSLGNFLTGQYGIHRQIGGIFSFRIDRGGSGGPKVTSPDLLLTYVDPKENYTIRKLSDVVSERRFLESPRSGDLESTALYDRVIQHARTYIPELNVR